MCRNGCTPDERVSLSTSAQRRDLNSLHRRAASAPRQGGRATLETVIETDESRNDDGLLSRLRLIEDRPLEDRAGAYAAVHEELRAVLEGGDAPIDGRVS